MGPAPFALCVDNTGYQASLIPGKVYRILPDPTAASDELVRVVDESGEDYLCHKDRFVFDRLLGRLSRGCRARGWLGWREGLRESYSGLMA
jgi:hypothetical protein